MVQVLPSMNIMSAFNILNSKVNEILKYETHFTNCHFINMPYLTNCHLTTHLTLMTFEHTKSHNETIQERSTHAQP